MFKTVTKVVEKDIKFPTMQLSSGYNEKEMMAKSTFSARDLIPHCPDSILYRFFYVFCFTVKLEIFACD